jgi:uncharacterized phage protein (TIGR02218 family)
MRAIGVELLTHLSGEVQTMATCWKVTRRDGLVMGFTDHDMVIEFESQTYEPASGFVSSGHDHSAELVADGSDLKGLLDSDNITEVDMMAGVYDHAEIEIFKVNYKDLSQGKMIIRVGWFGELVIKGGAFNVQMHGLSHRLSKTIGQLYSPSCRANLGDEHCGIDVGALKVIGNVESVVSRRGFVDSAREEKNGSFNYGVVTFTGGGNQAISMEIKEYKDGVISLMLPMSYDIVVGDGYELTSGCDKEFSTCRKQYNNVENFRGEPNVPGYDAILKTSGTL